jgi:hypothetical protein
MGGNLVKRRKLREVEARIVRTEKELSKLKAKRIVLCTELDNTEKCECGEAPRRIGLHHKLGCYQRQDPWEP